jgi:quinoprotein glucose dehydrogenase
MQILFKIIKISLFFFVSIITLILILFLIDATDYDRHFTNRSKFEVSYIHLNSRHSFHFSNYLKKNYFYFYEKFFTNSFKERWKIESEDERRKLPKTKIIKAKTNNFSKPIYKLEEYMNKNQWQRSHGNYFSTRFSNLSQINKSNIDQLKLAWTYEADMDSNSKKENQANAVYFNEKIFFPDVDNKLVALNGVNGKKIWEYQISEGIAAKRGLLIHTNKNNNKGKIFFTDNRNFLYCINTDGDLVNSFGVDGKIKIGLTPLPPVIYKGQLILITTDSIIKSYDLETGKINWKYKVNKTKNNIIFSNFTKGSPWGGLSLDTKRGLLFFTTGNPEPWHVGIFRPGDNLYANSLVAFDLNQKKIKWHFQEIPHDVWNYDFAAPPILTMLKRNGKNIDVVVAISKLGNVIILDRASGEPLFDILYKRAPVSNVPGERTSNYQINTKLPEKICRSEFIESYLTDYDDAFIKEFKQEKKNYSYGFPTPPLLGKKNISIGSCVRWAGGSVDTNKNILYITSDNIGEIITLIKDEDKKFNYYHEWDTFVDTDGFPAIKPPWGSITAFNLNNGKILWQKPFGIIKELEKRNIFNTGSTNRAGLTASAGNIIFASGTEDKMFRAFSSETGEELWNFQMDSAGSAPPTIYEMQNKQYVLVPAYEKDGNKVYSFTLK